MADSGDDDEEEYEEEGQDEYEKDGFIVDEEEDEEPEEEAQESSDEEVKAKKKKRKKRCGNNCVFYCVFWTKISKRCFAVGYLFFLCCPCCHFMCEHHIHRIAVSFVSDTAEERRHMSSTRMITICFRKLMLRDFIALLKQYVLSRVTAICIGLQERFSFWKV